MKNKVIAKKLQHQIMSEVSNLILALREVDGVAVIKALNAYSLDLQKIVDLVDAPCGKTNCGYLYTLGGKEEACDKMEVANDQ